MNYQQSCSSPTATVTVNSPGSSNCSSGSSNGGGNHDFVNNVRPLSVHMMNHCILCLESEEPSIIEEILTTNPKSILNFQPLVYYLTAIDPTDTGREQKTRLLESRKYFPVIGNLPPMCTQCYEILGEMYRLHLQLVDIQVKIQRQIALARRIVKYTVKEDRRSGRLATVRNKFFNELGTGMKCLLTRQEMEGLRYFLDNFHGLIVEAENKFIFPCPPPPPDPNSTNPQPPTPPPTTLMTLSYPVQFTSSSSASTPNNFEEFLQQQSCSTISFNIKSDSSYNQQQFSPVVTASSSLSMRSPSFSEISSKTSKENKIGASSEMIVVSGIDMNLKYEVEDDEGEVEREEEDDEQHVRKVVIIKEDLDAQMENDVDEEGNENADTKLIIEPVDEDEYIYPHQQPPEMTDNSNSIHLEGLASPSAFPTSPHLWKVQTQSCDVCNQMFHIANLPGHMMDHFGKRDVWSCDVCHQVYLSRSKLILHFEEFNTGSWCRQNSQWYRNLTHFCTSCSAQFPTQAFLHHHIFSYHETDQSLNSAYSCKMCCRKYKTEQALDFHCITHMHKAQRKKCWKFLQPLVPPSNSNSVAAALVSSRSCGKYSAGNSKATVSANNTKVVVAFPVCEESDDFSCEICGKKCVGSTSLLRHVKEVHKQQGKRKQQELSSEEQVNNSRKMTKN